MTKPVLKLNYYDDNSNGSISYYVQPAGYDSMSDYPGYESDNNNGNW